MNRKTFELDFITGLIEYDKSIFDRLSTFVYYFVQELGYLDESTISIYKIDYLTIKDTFYIWCYVDQASNSRKKENIRCDLDNGYGWQNLYKGLIEYVKVVERDNKLKDLGLI